MSYQDTNKGITVSSCLFDGTSSASAFCDGSHYWVWLFWGTHDEITLINNRVYNTAGRTPHAGGWARAQVRLRGPNRRRRVLVYRSVTNRVCCMLV